MAENITAELAANVWKIVVAEGDTVEPEGTLVILESMKMEIPVITEEGGIVVKIAVVENESVQEGDLLVVIE